MAFPVSFLALRAFIEAARASSIKQAAAAIGVTPGAVSQQIKLLEERLETRLLTRGNRRIALTAEGRRLFEDCEPGLASLEAAVERFERRRTRSATLVVSTTPSFAACWLIPRIGEFSEDHPEIEVRIETSTQLADIAGGGADVAIRNGTGAYPGLDAMKLADLRLIVVASPAFAQRENIATPADCLTLPLLQDRDRADWTAWFTANGLPPSPAMRKGPSYADDALLIAGAAASQGLAVVRDIYALSALEDGRLVEILKATAPVPTSYFTVTRPGRSAPKAGRLFRDWLASRLSAEIEARWKRPAA